MMKNNEFNERDFVILKREILSKEIPYMTDIDLAVFDRTTKSHIWLEFKTVKERTIEFYGSPFELNPNLFYKRERGSILYLWKTIKELNELRISKGNNPECKLYFIYFSNVEGYKNEFKICEIIDINDNKKTNEPITFNSLRMNKKEFTDWLKKINSGGRKFNKKDSDLN